MTEERFKELFEETGGALSEYEGDSAFLGLVIINKYLPRIGVEGADHDIIYSSNVNTLIEAGITEEDVITLRKLNWMIEMEHLACFV